MTTRAACSTLHVETPRGIDPLNAPRSVGLRDDIKRFINFLRGTIGGAPGLTHRRTVYKGTKRARGKVTVASGSGTVTTTVNGVAVSSHTADADDTVTAAAIVTDINASVDPLVNLFVDAASDAGSFALVSVPIGTVIECCGYFFKATGAASGLPGEFSVSGNDAADAAALAAAINAMLGLNELVFAEVVSGSTVTVRTIRPKSELLQFLLGASDASVTVVQFAASKVVNVTARRKTIFGNAITLAAGGTGMTASGARLTGGTEATAVTY